MPYSIKRRNFLSWMGVGAIAASFPVALAACTPKAETEAPTATAEDASAPIPTESGGGEFTLVGTTAELTQQGFLTSDAFSEPVIVIEDPTSAGALIALSAKCTHTGCTVAWQEDLFACPCHGSKFNPDGSVVNGPADKPLAQYAAKIEGDSVLVAAS